MRARTATADRRFDPFGRRQKGDAAAPDSERMIRRRLSFPNRVSLFMFFFCVAFLFVFFFARLPVYGVRSIFVIICTSRGSSTSLGASR